MKVDLRLIGLPAPPGTINHNRAAPGFVNVDSKRNGVDQLIDAIHGRVPSNEKSNVSHQSSVISVKNLAREFTNLHSRTK